MLDDPFPALHIPGVPLSALRVPVPALHIPVVPPSALRVPDAPPAPDLAQLVQQLGQGVSTVLQPIWHALQEWVQRCGAILSSVWQNIGRQLTISFRSRRPRPRNTRIQMVQAKRKRLGLPQDGKLPGLSRKQSYALAARYLSTGVDNLESEVRCG